MFSWLMVTPPVLFLVALVGYPFVYGIWLSLEDRPVAKRRRFVGLRELHRRLARPGVLAGRPQHLCLHARATVLKMVGGLGLALVMNQDFRFKNLIRALMLLPFIVPTVLRPSPGCGSSIPRSA